MAGNSLAWLSLDERRELTTRSLAFGLFIFLAHFAFYGVTLWAAVADLPLWGNLLASVLNGFSIGLIFIIGHDTCHQAFVPSRRLNQILTRIAFIPSLHAASLWDLFHNRVHHVYPNLKGRDCVWVPLSKAEYDTASSPRRLLERAHRGFLGPLTYYVLGLWLPRLVLPLAKGARHEWRRHIFDSVFVIVCLALTLAGIAYLGHALAPDRPLWLTMLLGWVLPFAVWNYLMGMSIYLHHTHPAIPWFDNPDEWSFYNGNVRATAHVYIPAHFAPVWQRLMEHTAHHMLPTIPLYKLHRAQKMAEAKFGDDVTRYELTWSRYRQIRKACKLYDYERKCWTDFDGKPTTPPIALNSTPQSTPMAVPA